MTSSHRRAYVDWARGIAVLLMIEAHALDAWTKLKPAVRHTISFRDATVLGGFAAPMFLWLAGLAVVLAATRAAGRPRRPRPPGGGVCPGGLRDFLPPLFFPVPGLLLPPRAAPGDPVFREN